MASRDAGHLQVLEAILVTLVLLGGAYTVFSMREPSTDTSRSRTSVEATSQDAMTVLAGITDARGSLLDIGVSDSIHCQEDSAPSPTLCYGNTSSNLSLRITGYLPEGAGWALVLDNGYVPRDLYRSPVPGAEVVSSATSFVPDWNLTFATPELSCYEATQDVNVTLLAIRHGALANLSALSINASLGGPWNGTRSYSLASAWNATLPAAVRSASDNVTVNATGKRGTYPGQTAYAACNLGGQGASIVSALRSSTFSLTNAPVNGSATLTANLAPLASLTGVTLLSSNATVYEPLPPLPNASDAYAPAAVIALGATATPTATWTVAPTSLYGVHPVVLRALLNVTLPNGSAASVEARLVGTMTVTLPSGTVPIETPYRAELQVWLPDWR
jgi:hypothetical protein